MSKTNNLVFKGLQVVAWIIFVGLCINAGALIVNFAVSLISPKFIPNLYEKLDLSAVRQQHQFGFYAIYNFILLIAILKAVLFYVVVILMTKLDLSKPFNPFVANKIKKISYLTLSIGFVSYLTEKTVDRLIQTDINLNEYWDGSTAYILMGAVVYIIAVIFKKGIEIQNEVDLTI